MSDQTTQLVSAPLLFPPAPFDVSQARMCIDLMVTSYKIYYKWKKLCKPKESDFNWVPEPPSGTHFSFSQTIWGTDTAFFFLKSSEPFAFVAWNGEGDVYLVFRGTESADDWIEDATVSQRPYMLAPGYGNLHHGFKAVYDTMSDSTLAALAAVPDPKRLFITGHSLGSSLATLATPDVITNSSLSPSRIPVFHYNFASPRTGDPEFASAFNQNGVSTWRVVDTSDIVPNVPPSILGFDIYGHVGIQVSYTAQYDSIGGNHSYQNSYAYAIEHPEQPQGALPSK